MVLVDHLTTHSRPTTTNTNTNTTNKIFQTGTVSEPFVARETMQFRDNNPGCTDSRGTNIDPTRDLAMVQDVTLDSWFSRPIKIAEFPWQVNQPLFQRFNPWTLFWENPRNIEKISNYHLLRSTLHVKFLVNGNAFYYGRAIAAYEPLAPLDNTSPFRTWIPADRVRGSQRMHVYINPTTSEGGSLELPFFWPQNNWVITRNEWRNMGEIILASFNDLAHANGGTDTINISVMAWAENVKFAIPTRAVPQPSIPESGKVSQDEHDTNIISRPASNVARVAGTLSNVPVIGPYAKATQIGANAVSASAKIFGLSAPNELSYDVYEPRAKHSFAVTDVKQTANKLTIDSKQELTLDPRTTGIRGDDELPIASIAGRESYLTQFTWQQTQTSGELLWNTRVDPGLKARNGTEWHFPACAFAALPFQYWRGTMRFRFQIVASEYHKGRLRFAYDPWIGGSTSEYNTHYSTIHDIAESKDFTMDIGWAQNVPYRSSLGWYTGAEYGNTPLISNLDSGNGVLSVHVLNKLATPSGTVAPIEINVFVSMLDDFEVAAPDDKMSYLKFRSFVSPPQSGKTSYSDFMKTLTLKKSIPESGVVQDEDDQGGEVTDPPPIDTIADNAIDTPNTTMVFMGEVIGSFRALLKRAYFSEMRLLTEIPTASVAVISRSSFPTYGGFISGQIIASNSMVTTFGDGRYYNTATTTLMNYLGRAFLGWRGSTRWTVDTSTVSLSAQESTSTVADLWNSVPFILSRSNRYTSNQIYQGTAGELTTNLPQKFNEAQRGGDCFGMHLGNTSVNPIQTVEVPYLSTDRFNYTFTEENYSVGDTGPSWKLSLMLPNSSSLFDNSFLKFYVSAGEDFNFFFFNGLPPVYYETAYATDTVA